MKQTWILAALAFALVGCNSKTTPANTPTNAPADNSAAGSSNSTSANTNPAGDATGASLPLDQLPAELKTDAYSYYGFSNSNPLNYEITMGGKTLTGTQTYTLKSVKDGVAVFEEKRTGALQDQLGNSETSLEKDGVYVVSSDKMDVGKHQMELPADLSPGKTWKQTSTANGTTLNSTYTVKGKEKVKTKAGEFEAVLVTADINEEGSTPQKLSMKAWYAKDRGVVKAIFTDKTSKPVLTMEQTS